ncbi:MAG: queuosine precursor transporter, partial [bacterium]
MQKRHETAAVGRLLPIWTGIFVAVLVLTPSMCSKLISIGPFVFTGAILTFPITYIFNDLLTEVYGYNRSRMIIWTGLAMQIFAAAFYWVIDIWPYPLFWNNQASYHAILGQMPRVVIASLTAYFCGEFANSVILSKMKFSEGGARGFALAKRFVFSTVVGEGVDSLFFFTIAF